MTDPLALCHPLPLPIPSPSLHFPIPVRPLGPVLASNAGGATPHHLHSNRLSHPLILGLDIQSQVGIFASVQREERGECKGGITHGGARSGTRACRRGIGMGVIRGMSIKQDLRLRWDPASFPKSFMSFAVSLDSFKNLSAREVSVVLQSQGQTDAEATNVAVAWVFRGVPRLHHLIDTLRLDDLSRTPVFEDLKLVISVGECPKRMVYRTCFALAD